MTDANAEIQATSLDEPIIVRLSRRGRRVGWFSVVTLLAAALWGLQSPQTAPAFFSWAPAQLLITLSALQMIVQLIFDQSKGLVRIGPERTSVWRVGGLPRRYASSEVSVRIGSEKSHLLVDQRPLSRLDLFDITGAFTSATG